MADDKFILSVDDDWKKQAQEEKRRLAEEQARKAAQPAAASPMAGGSPAGASEAVRARRPGEVPEASFTSLTQSLLTQTLFYLGDLGSRGQGGINLDMARYQVDLLSVLDQKSKGNLTATEQQVLDLALYEASNRFVAVASQFIGP
jgi:hypothetical protein